jgi:hypothetical protein
MNSLGRSDFVTIQPKGEVNPFGKGSFGNYHMSYWKPTAAGKYKVRLTVDFRAKEMKEWHGWPMGDKARAKELQRLFDRVPKILLETEVEFEVKP